jgi:hypothetical protein
MAVSHRASRQERRRRRHHRRLAGKFGIAVVSPPLDDAGNSVRAQRAIADISGALGGNPYAPQTTVTATPSKASFEVYGFAMLDIGHDFKQIHPDWYDTLRLTKLPKFANEFGEDNSTFAGVRQSRLGVKSSAPTPLGEFKTIFEFELFGTGVDSGQTTFRLRHAWGELGRIGAGQYWSPFTDPDVFPNSLEYWGPTGLPWYRNVQLRYTAIQTDTSNLMLALARPARAAIRGFTPTVSSFRASVHVSRCLILRLRTSTRRNGATSAPPGCCVESTGMTPSTTRSICPETPPAGDGTSARTSRPARATFCGCSSLSAKAFRTK